jgi:hypothetical protein
MAPLPDGILPAPPDAPESPDADLALPESERWHIRDQRSAEWVMRKLARARRDLAAVEDLMAVYSEQLEAWRERATASASRTAQWATAALTAWALDERDADPEARTQHLPSGTVTTRMVPARPEVLDAGQVAAALARAQVPGYDDIVSATVRINATNLRQATTIADEWRAVLTCGCAPTRWQVGTVTPTADGPSWPWNPAEHDCGATTPPPGLAIMRWERGRVGVVVALDPDGAVVPIDGARAVAGYVSANVTTER